MNSSRILPPTLTSAIIETLLYGPSLLICITSVWLLWDQNRTRAGRITTKRPSFARGIPMIIAGLCLLLALDRQRCTLVPSGGDVQGRLSTRGLSQGLSRQTILSS
ncbi:uncharacterized protein B0H18DRAFT_451570 [Fomitopsis serialis]|uniref:uncharacterized protein n=1 Tax=Fomitopsis serialis TaxID=139415 RepID=UPI0020071F2A|nr:uncharacterized protein B0H18DRAFT_451570 [Neoantrodia serialis]KAH9923885.1 hypothetical protein B0H18DRAFT_451570 [Neoantrodia serialis]